MSPERPKTIEIDQQNFLLGNWTPEDWRMSHEKSRRQKAEGYPNRFEVPDDKVSWDVDFSEYVPVPYTAIAVYDNDRNKKQGGWADPEWEKSDGYYAKLCEEKPRRTFEQERFDDTGKPLNPRGRTGIEGRGSLGNWGPNNAADPLVTGIDENGFLRMALINRHDTEWMGPDEVWAIPGGMVDAGEKVSRTLGREFGEEVGVEMNFEEASKVYQGYMDDPRNTDNAWMETEAWHLHLENHRPQLRAGDDAAKAGWQIVDRVLLEKMYAGHADLVRLAVYNWQEETGYTVGADGKVYYQDGKLLVNTDGGEMGEEENKTESGGETIITRFEREMMPEVIAGDLELAAKRRVLITVDEFAERVGGLSDFEKSEVQKILEAAASKTVGLLDVNEGKLVGKGEVSERAGYSWMVAAQHCGYVARELGQALDLETQAIDGLRDDLWEGLYSKDGTDQAISDEERVGVVVRMLGEDKEDVGREYLENNGWLLGEQSSDGGVVANMPGVFAGQATEAYAQFLNVDLGELMGLSSEEIKLLVEGDEKDSPKAKVVLFGLMAAQQGWQLVNARDGRYEKAVEKNLYHSFNGMVRAQGESYWGQVIKDWDQIRSYLWKSRELGEGVLGVDRDKL